MCPVQSVTYVSGRSQYFIEISPESARNFTFNSSPVICSTFIQARSCRARIEASESVRKMRDRPDDHDGDSRAHKKRGHKHPRQDAAFRFPAGEHVQGE